MRIQHLNVRSAIAQNFALVGRNIASSILLTVFWNSMDNQVVKNALGGLNKLLSRARRALWEIGREYFVQPEDELGGFADPHAALRGTLSELHDALLIILEAAQLPETKASTRMPRICFSGHPRLCLVIKWPP
jgi:hypothetical protein